MSNDRRAVERILRDAAAAISEADPLGRTPLREAVIQSHFDICKILVAGGANVNERDKNNWTALHFAAQEYVPDIVEFLIRKGA